MGPEGVRVRKLRIGGEGEMTDWLEILCALIAIVCVDYMYFCYRKLQKESEIDRIRLRREMDYALCIDNILTGATMHDDRRKELQNRFHHYLAAIGSGDWDLVAKRRDEMDDVLARSGWEWIDDRS